MKKDERREKKKIRQTQSFILKIIWAIYYLSNTSVPTWLLINTKKKGQKKKKRKGLPLSHQLKIGYGGYALSTNLLSRVLDVCWDRVQMAKAKESQRSLVFLQKKIPKECANRNKATDHKLLKHFPDLWGIKRHGKFIKRINLIESQVC